mmetsp:Transcript_20668/g.53831  ORF Transcript_20668/g.53831 Transcript_20668/m.53831 type:complete len:213 (-) Transcript_20668:545-1183(-)
MDRAGRRVGKAHDRVRADAPVQRPRELVRPEPKGGALLPQRARGDVEGRIRGGPLLHRLVAEHAVDLAVVRQAARARALHQNGMPVRVLVLEAAPVAQPRLQQSLRERRVAGVERAALDVPEGVLRAGVREGRVVHARVGVERGDVVSLAVVVRVEVAVEDAADARVVQRGERGGHLIVVVAVVDRLSGFPLEVDRLQDPALEVPRQHALVE